MKAARTCLAVAAGLTLFANAASAAVLLQDTFEGLTNGNLNGQNGWTGTDFIQVVPGGLSYSAGTVTVAGGSQAIAWSGASGTGTRGDATIAKTFTTQSSDVWFSFVGNLTSTTSASNYYIGVSDDADANNAGVVGQIITNSGAYRAGTRNNSAIPTSSNISIASDTPYFLVARLSKDGTAASNFDRVEAWINPTSSTLGAGANYFVSADNTFGLGIANGIDTFLISVFGDTSSVKLDNIRVGTTQADVLDVYVPEPASLGLLALGGLVIGRRRRD